jgi:hypothetical protein
MSKHSKSITNKFGDDPEADLRLLPYVLGKMAGARMLGGRLVNKDRKFEETEWMSDEFVEYSAGAERLISFLNGFYGAIEESFGKEFGKVMFDRVIAANSSTKADRKLRSQIDLLQQYFAEPKPNASRTAREAASGNDKLAASKLRALSRLRKNRGLSALAKTQLLLGLSSAKGWRGRPPTLKEVCQSLSAAGKPID